MRKLRHQVAVTWVYVLLFAPIIWAQQPVVTYSSPKAVFVSITQPTSLYSVLQAFCEQSHTDCDIAAAKNDGLTLAPMNIRGSWEQVVRKLFEGTDLNFTSVAPRTTGVPGRLIVAARPGNRLGPSVVAQEPRNDTGGDQLEPYSAPVETLSQTASEPFGETNQPSINSLPQSGTASMAAPVYSSGPNPSSDALAKFLSGETVTTKEIGVPLPGMSSQRSVATGLPLPAAPREAPANSGGPLPVSH